MRVSAVHPIARSFLVCLSLALLATPRPAVGQAAAVDADTGAVEIELADGAVLVGRIESNGGGVVRIRLLSGDVIEVRADRVRATRAVRGRVVDGELWPEDPNATRLFFGPTARTLERGAGYFSVYELFIPFLAVGATDRITLAAGTPLIFASDTGTRPFWFAPKVQVLRRPSLQAAVGVLHFLMPGESESFGVAYGVVSGGSADQGWTAGVGRGYAGGDFADGVVLMGGAELRSSARVKLVTENYFFPADGFGLVSAGPRFFGEKLSADLGLAVPVDGEAGFVVFPLVSFVYNW